MFIICISYHLFNIHNNQWNHIIIGKYSTWWFYLHIHWFYQSIIIYFHSISIWIFYSMTSSINLLFYYQYEWYYQNRYWYQYSFQILVSKWKLVIQWNMREYYLQQSSILSIFDFHQISKNSRNIYSFIHIHTNTSDWFGFNILEWIRKTNCLNIRNIYSWFNHSISN